MIGDVLAYAGVPVTIRGYAQDFAADICAMQFSCDEGETWTSYETPGCDTERDVNWSFTFVPPHEGRYRLLVRALRGDGKTTPEPAVVYVEAGATPEPGC